MNAFPKHRQHWPSILDIRCGLGESKFIAKRLFWIKLVLNALLKQSSGDANATTFNIAQELKNGIDLMPVIGTMLFLLSGGV